MRDAAQADGMDILAATRPLPPFAVAFSTGGCAESAALKVCSVAFYAVLERRAIAGRVVNAFQADGMDILAAARKVPSLSVAFGAGRFAACSPLKRGAMTSRAIINRLAVIWPMVDAA